ncbi:hypothetical protein [Bacillus sp. FJAT-18017]|nr:hypothetical protein [Bacillus sp. FJAT-18017]
MEQQRPLHFDGSAHPEAASDDILLSQPILTEDARLNIGKNPYALEQGE